MSTHHNVGFATSFKLQDGVLTPVGAGVVAQVVDSGSLVTFAEEKEGSTTAPIYCAVVSY